VGSNAHIGKRKLKCPNALLLSDKTSDRSIDLVHEKAFGTDRQKSQNAIDSISYRGALWQLERF
jgi:hypothetical protein